MDRQKQLLLAGLIIILLAALTGSLLAMRDPEDRETLYQVSTIDALQQGVYDGILPVGELKRHGNFRIGTFDALDGEMIVLEGIVYQATADGRVSRAPDNLITPFATVTDYEEDFTLGWSRPASSASGLLATRTSPPVSTTTNSTPCPLGVGIDTISGGARQILHNSHPATYKTVEERAFADVGPANQGYDRFGHNPASTNKG